MSSSKELKRPTDKARSVASNVPYQLTIRFQAYELNQKHGAHHAIEDWLQAEAAPVLKKPICYEKSNRKTA